MPWSVPILVTTPSVPASATGSSPLITPDGVAPDSFTHDLHADVTVDRRWRAIRTACWGMSLTIVCVLVVICLRRIWTSDRGDFRVFYHAARAMRTGADIYTANTGNYIYPPLVAFLFQPLAKYPQNIAATIWLFVSLALALASIVMTLAVVQRRVTGPFKQAQGSLAFLLGLILIVPCLRNELLLGQTDTLLIACLAGALLLIDRLPAFAGVLVGIAFNVKYLPVVLVPYLMLRKRWRVLGGIMVGCVFAAVIPAVSTGWSGNLHDWNVATSGMGTMVSTATADSASQELNVAKVYTVRWPRSVSFTTGIFRFSDPGTVVPPVAGVMLAMLVFAAGVWAIYRRHRVPLFAGRHLVAERSTSRSSLLVNEWCILVVVMLVFSPQTTSRHLLMLLPLDVLIAARIVTATNRRDRQLMAAAGAILFLQFALPSTDFTKRICLQSFGAVAALTLALIADLRRIRLNESRRAIPLSATQPKHSSDAFHQSQTSDMDRRSHEPTIIKAGT